jgi:hypothetical protein
LPLSIYLYHPLSTGTPLLKQLSSILGSLVPAVPSRCATLLSYQYELGYVSDNEVLPYQTLNQLFIGWLNNCVQKGCDTWYIHKHQRGVATTCDYQELELAIEHEPLKVAYNHRKDEARPLAAQLSDAAPPNSPELRGDSDGESAVSVGTTTSFFRRCTDGACNALSTGYRSPRYIPLTCPHQSNTDLLSVATLHLHDNIVPCNYLLSHVLGGVNDILFVPYFLL